MGYGDNDAWVKKLKVGDKVVVDLGHSYYDRRYVDRVAKITPKGVISLKSDVDKGGTTTFDENGYERGKRPKWSSRAHLELYTVEAVKEIMRSRYADKLSNMRVDELRKLSYKALKTAVDALFPKEKKEDKVGEDKDQENENQG